MRIFSVAPEGVQETADLPATLSPQGFVWISLERPELERRQLEVQSCLLALCGIPLVELHLSDLLNDQLPSHYDYTSQYDLLVFRRLAAGTPGADNTQASGRRRALPVLRRIDTSPVGFAVFDRILLTIHPSDCAARDAYASKLLSAAADARSSGARLPASPADLMMRIVNQMVDGYLDLRRELTRQLDHWQAELLAPRSRFSNWASLLDARMTLHQLNDTADDQTTAVQDWIDALETWPQPVSIDGRREQELLKVRSRDVLEHVERVVHHVRRLEQGLETALQMHFSIQGNRTNDIMRTLTAITAIFLPLNLITGFFGMNFEVFPFIHRPNALWWTLATMVGIAAVLGLVFWRKRYLARTGR